MTTPRSSGLVMMIPSIGTGTIFSPEAREITSSTLPTLSHKSIWLVDKQEFQHAEQNRHLPQVLGWVLNKQIRGCESLHICKVLDRHLIVLSRLRVCVSIQQKIERGERSEAHTNT